MTDVFLSVGRTSTTEQEKFVSALIETLRADELNPRALNRTEFTSARPLEAIRECMQQCKGSVIVAFERIFVERAIELRGSGAATAIEGTGITTVWNHLEGGMAVALGHPLLIVAERGLKSEGLVENSNGWFVQWIPMEESALRTPSFRGVLSHWRKLLAAAPTPIAKPEELTVDQVIRGMKVATLWGVAAAVLGLVASTAGLAYWLGSHRPDVSEKPSSDLRVSGSANAQPVEQPHRSGASGTRRIANVAAIATQRLKRLAFDAVNTDDGFVMNCDISFAAQTFKCMNQGAPVAVESHNEEILQREFETSGAGTVRTALTDAAGSGYSLARISTRVIFDRMGAVDDVQTLKGFAVGPDGREHLIGD